jgi:nucleoside-diphosphate-sugar epimerase
MNLKEKNICITGAGGFIGTYLCSALMDNGANVIAIDTILTDRLKNLQTKSTGSLKFINEDIAKIENLQSILVDVEVMIHLASVASPKVCNTNTEIGFTMNVDGTKKILDYSRHVSRFIFPSSLTVYGEHDGKLLKETDNTNGNDLYSITKIMGEYLCKANNYMYDMPYTILRFGNTFGPHQASNYLIPSLIIQGKNEGKIDVWDPRIIRDFIFVEDTIASIISVLKNESTKNEIFNVSNSIGYSVKDMVEMISEMLHVKWNDMHNYQDVPASVVLDSSKLIKLTGWKPKYSIPEALRITVEHYKSVG